MPDSAQLSHLEALRTDVRDEIKKRIEQRDKYSVQMTIALGAIVGVAFSKPELQRVLIAAPLVSINFTALIVYSYRVHDALAEYVRERLEPALSSLCGTRLALEWEHFYAERAKSGIRKIFFVVALWVVSILTLAYLFLAVLTVSTYPCLRICITDPKFFAVLIAFGFSYLVACGWLTAKMASPSSRNEKATARTEEEKSS